MYEIKTPDHLLFGWKLYQENLNWESNSDIVKLDLPKRTEEAESILEHFWKRWRFECYFITRMPKTFQTEKSVISGEKWYFIIIRRKAA